MRTDNGGRGYDAADDDDNDQSEKRDAQSVSSLLSVRRLS